MAAPARLDDLAPGGASGGDSGGDSGGPGLSVEKTVDKVPASAL